MHDLKSRRRIIIPIVLLVVIGAAAWYLVSNRSAANASRLEASGTVEAVSVDLAPELSGKVVEVLVEKGQQVKEDQALFRLDDELLQGQRQRASAALESARANQAIADSGLASAEAALQSARVYLEAAQATAEAERLPVLKSLDDLNINAPAMRGEAARNVALANRLVRDAVYMLDNYTVSSLQSDLTPTEGISLTKELLDDARAAFEPFRFYPESDDRREELKEALDNAQSEYDSAVRRIELAASLEAAESRLRKAEDDLSRLQDGPDPQDVAILEARLAAIDAATRQAEAAVDSASVAVQAAQARLDASEAAVAQAQAELDLIDVQIRKLTVHSPIDGVVLERNVEAGEVVQMGAPVITVGGLAKLLITVYLSESSYGQINLGQTARVTVDSFPGREFQAIVTHIADQAEFTPRNVQTEEGRRNTVFAIELSIENPEGLLKPGMPADVNFE